MLQMSSSSAMFDLWFTTVHFIEYFRVPNKRGGGENNRGGLEMVRHNNNRGGWNNRGGAA